MSKPRQPFRFRWLDVVCADLRVPSSERHLACALATKWMSDEGRCFPGVDSIAERMGCTSRAVQRCLSGESSLVRCGYLEVERSRGGPKRTHKFQARIPGTSFTVSEKSARDLFTLGGDANGDIHDANGDIHANNGERRSPEPSRTIQEPTNPLLVTSLDARSQWASIGKKTIGDLRAACALVAPKPHRPREKGAGRTVAA